MEVGDCDYSLDVLAGVREAIKISSIFSAHFYASNP